jgi:hypothetical protein
MAFNYSPKIPTNGLVAYFDVSNPKCIDASQAITTNTRLNNLVGGGSLQMRPYDVTNDNMTFVIDKGNYVYNQNGINSGYPCWYSTENVTRTDDFTFTCWFKYNYGSSNQRSNNIYGGGFNGRTSFYLSPGGTSSSHGVLRYSDVGGTNGYSVISNWGGNDGSWHQFTAVDSGGDGAHNTKVYIDGVYKGQGTSNASYDTPDGTGQMTWGSWSNTYGNFNGRSNCYAYYNRALTADEVLDAYNATKSRFQ